jgi:membrane protease YdiL (CAAX protease family)
MQIVRCILHRTTEHKIDSFMAEKSEVFSAIEVSPGARRSTIPRLGWSGQRRHAIEVFVVVGWIVAAAWTPQRGLNQFFSLTAAACVVAFAVTGKWSLTEMGLTRPLAGAASILTVGGLLCAAIALAGMTLRFAGAGHALPWSRSAPYVVWALVQEFILQSVLFLRLETILGPKQAVIAAASLFAFVHLPSPVLTVLAFCGGIVFSELFRRFRNLYPIGMIHAALGLTIAASLPDHWLHHMRVGIGYLILHS